MRQPTSVFNQPSSLQQKEQVKHYFSLGMFHFCFLLYISKAKVA